MGFAMIQPSFRQTAVKFLSDSLSSYRVFFKSEKNCDVTFSHVSLAYDRRLPEIYDSYSTANAII